MKRKGSLNITIEDAERVCGGAYLGNDLYANNKCPENVGDVAWDEYEQMWVISLFLVGGNNYTYYKDCCYSLFEISEEYIDVIEIDD
jgi:hypothetical protein